MHSNPYLAKIFVAEWIIKYKMKAKLITSQMFEQSWESELNKFISRVTIRVIDIKFSTAAMDEPIGSDMALYSALVLYEDV